MGTWRVAKSLEVLLAEVNAAAPNRSKVSDGSIGNAEHSSRESDHNPNPAGVVRARDFTDDPAGGCDSSDLAERVRLLGIEGHPALGAGAYVISDGRIASATYAWSWRSYGGSNPHNHHCHVSVATAATGYDFTGPWLQEEDDMYSDDDRKLAATTASDLATLTKRFDRFANNSWRREAALAKALKDQGVDVEEILAKVSED